MIYFKNFEHTDDFDGDKVFWIQIHEFGIPEDIKDAAKSIDEENYINDGYGVCVNYNADANEFHVVEDAPGCELYYVDNNGDKHWFKYSLSEMETYMIISKCIDAIENNPNAGV